MRILITVGIFLAIASASAETAYYRVELSPSGSLVSIGTPVVRGSMLLLHGYPDGKLMSLRKSEVRSVTPITAHEATAPARKSVVVIGNLAMQGGAPAPGASARPPAARAPAGGPSVIATPDGLAVTVSASTPAAPSPQNAPNQRN